MMRWAANAIVCKPDEQKRLIVAPGTVTGQPARSAIWRADVVPVAPSAAHNPSAHRRFPRVETRS